MPRSLSRYIFCVTLIPVFFIRYDIPVMALSGAWISCDMRARKLDLTWFAAFASFWRGAAPLQHKFCASPPASNGWPTEEKSHKKEKNDSRNPEHRSVIHFIFDTDPFIVDFNFFFFRDAFQPFIDDADQLGPVISYSKAK